MPFTETSPSLTTTPYFVRERGLRLHWGATKKGTGSRTGRQSLLIDFVSTRRGFSLLRIGWFGSFFLRLSVEIVGVHLAEKVADVFGIAFDGDA